MTNSELRQYLSKHRNDEEVFSQALHRRLNSDFKTAKWNKRPALFAANEDGL